MADYNYEELKHKTVAELRQIAKEFDHEANKDYTQLNKEHLIQAVCKALGVDTLEYHQEMVSGFNKANAKAKMRALSLNGRLRLKPTITPNSRASAATCIGSTTGSAYTCDSWPGRSSREV